MIRYSYLVRLDHRAHARQQKRQIVFGLVLGWIMTVLGAFNYFLVTGANDAIWHAVLIAGMAILLVTVSVPAAIGIIERPWVAATRWIGRAVFATILTTGYFVFFLPVGRIMRLWRGNHPFYSWGDGSPVAGEGWVSKDLPAEMRATASRRLPLLAQPFVVISFFVRRGQYLFLPALIVLLLLGLIMFFVQSSALAPFIYTLF
ncbi:MAG: hypothetical protein HYX75_25840 [Acidobacteria bacterium]|nr:hypothetical protein [Acidobacteriota bacterium]